MRNKILSTMVAAGMMMYGASAFAGVSNPPTAVNGGSGTVNFKAVIQNGACDIKEPNLNVDFGQVSTRNIKNTISTLSSLSQDFTIRLSDCSLSNSTSDAFSKATVSFTGTAIKHQTILSDATGDTGVGIEIKKKGGKNVVSFDGQTVSDDFDLSVNNPNPNLDFTAYLVQEDSGKTVTEGVFSATATYTLTYK